MMVSTQVEGNSSRGHSPVAIPVCLRFILAVSLVCVPGFFNSQAFGQQWSAERGGVPIRSQEQTVPQLQTLPPPDQFVAKPPGAMQQEGQPTSRLENQGVAPGDGMSLSMDGYPYESDGGVVYSDGYIHRPILGGLFYDGPVRRRLRENREFYHSRGVEGGYQQGLASQRHRPILGGVRRPGPVYDQDGRMIRSDRPIRDFIFPVFPLFRQRWPSSPGLNRPRSFWLNPFAIQQGLGNLIFRGNYPADTGALGFPYSMVPSHMVDRVPRPFFDLGRNQIQGRHIGRGVPFQDSSWNNRPFHLSLFTGVLFTGDLTDRTSSSNGLYNGFRLGWDFDHYWGSEFRFGFGSHDLNNRVGTVDIRTVDISVLYYPWGDSRWRPYTGVGLGFGSYEFINASNTAVKETSFQLPLSIGLKYAAQPWWAMRVEAVNIFSFETGDLNFMNNVMLSASVEFHFGGRRRLYFPFDTGPSGSSY